MDIKTILLKAFGVTIVVASFLIIVCAILFTTILMVI